MKTIENTTKRRIYISPVIDLIKLDNEISLALQSEPPIGPNEIAQVTPLNYSNPFKNTDCV